MISQSTLMPMNRDRTMRARLHSAPGVVGPAACKNDGIVNGELVARGRALEVSNPVTPT